MGQHVPGTADFCPKPLGRGVPNTWDKTWRKAHFYDEKGVVSLRVLRLAFPSNRSIDNLMLNRSRSPR